MAQNKRMATTLTTNTAVVRGRTGPQNQIYTEKEKLKCSPTHIIEPLSQHVPGTCSLNSSLFT